MQYFSADPRESILSLWRNRGLIKALIRREVVGRYRGSFFGLFWMFFNPVLMLAIYTFVFSVVFKARWAGGGDSKTEFALVLFAGLMVFNLFSECISRAPALILSNANYVKKVVFPLEILPWVSLGSALFHVSISFIVWFIFFIAVFGSPPMTCLLLPVLTIPLLAITMGVSWFLASLGVYLRDISQVIGLSMTLLMFLSPIFYPITALPEEYQALFQLNPLTPSIEMVRNALIWGKSPDRLIFLVYLLESLIIFIVGFAWFQKTRRGFADVL